jgi:hypothetical protein
MRSELVNGERFTNDVHRSKSVENLAETSRLNSVNFQIPILRLLAHQLVAHTAANQQRASALLTNRFRNLQHLIRNFHVNSIKAGNAA